MTMPLAGTDSALLQWWRPGLWRLRLPQGRMVVASVTDRTAEAEGSWSMAGCSRGTVTADQVHGLSLAAVDLAAAPAHPVAGCDALVTQTFGLGLAIRTADCLPLFLWDPAQRVVGVAHAGWRGLAGQLPARLIRFVHQRYHCNPADLWIGIGPSIRACCYDVEPAFEVGFNPWVQLRDGRRTCDLTACAISQLLDAGVRAERILDSGQCTACDPDRWFSLRRDGEACGRLVSCITMTP